MPLLSLRVRDLATIADVTLDVGPGLNVLTGETGAGKSMLVDALALLLGDRADRAVVRPGASRTVIEGVIDQPPVAARRLLEQSGIDPEEQLILRREVTSEGRSRAWINSSPATMGMLASLGETLVDLHGQHQTLQLLDGGVQRDLLDAFANAQPAREAVRIAHTELRHLREEAVALSARRDEARRRADWLRHVVDEIDAAKIHPGEDAALDRDATRLGQAGALAEHARRIAEAVEDDAHGARAALARAERALQSLERIDSEVARWQDLLDGAYAQLDELARLATDYAADLSEDPERLADIERRRDRLARLRMKHGATLADVLAVRDQAREELDLLDTADVDLRALQSRITAAELGLQSLAGQLTGLRVSGGERLAREVSRILPSLGLSGGELQVSLQALPEPGIDGAETIHLLVRLNRGMEARPLAKVASGGELSRLMLALKVVLARHDAVPTLVFDELDQGIGGEVGAKIGEALARVAERHQVLVITHLPQIAARADHHLRIEKATRAGVATSDVSILRGEDRVQELARMLGDADSDAARRLAMTLLGEGKVRSG